MIEYIRNVKMNYTYYYGTDSYSDGEIEDELLDIVSSQKDIKQILREDNRWPILYHFSPNRHNLLEWFLFKENSEILEIGAGCGALTGLFCEKLNNVTCIELSKKRALINAYRNQDKDNLEIIVGNFNDIHLFKKYDYISLIGVLEYAALYTDSNSPHLAFLMNIKDYLKNDGVLIIAIENKLGLKYWAGSREDHTGELFGSIQNYPMNQNVVTFSKLELENLLSRMRFRNINFYYPFPDYKLPSQIFSNTRLPFVGEIKSQNYNYDQTRIVLFDEESVMNNIIQNDLFPTFSNSFLIFCSN